MPGPQDGFRFDVAFSFAGKNRRRVMQLAKLLRDKLGDGRVFYDDWFRVEIRSGHMDINLQRVYGEQTQLIVVALSEPYSDRMWTRIEWETIRSLRAGTDEIKHPAHRFRFYYLRFDDAEVPGFTALRGYEDARKRTSKEIVADILEQLSLLREASAASRNAPRRRPANVAKKIADHQKLQSPPIPILFYHPATNDQFYSRREHELAWLDGCAKDAHIRLATVTGVGGLGKTSLVGHWIAVRRGWQHRAFRGVFFYSFYSDRETQHFFAAFLKFVCKVEKIKKLPADKPLHHLAAAALRNWRYLVVLDGVEVLQQDENDPHYGWINDGELNEFVARVGEGGESLLVLTSRFPFPEITRDHPEAARELKLKLLDDDDGAALLEKCGLTDDLKKRQAWSHQFGGHPLALRLFAGACQADPFSDPTEAAQRLQGDRSDEALPDPDAPGLDTDERARRKQRRQFYKLLRWFQEKLPAPKRRLLQLVALFREPVPTATLVALAAGLDAMRADFGDCDEAHLRFLLDVLVREHLLQREDAPGSDTARWSAHPIVRDIFRDEALHAGDTVAKQFAEIVAGKSDGSEPKSVAELQPILEAIEVLLTAGDFKAANELYGRRLENGYVFQYIPAPQEGLRCARGFVEPEEHQVTLEQTFGRGRLGFYLNEAALFGSILGEMEAVERNYAELAKYPHAEKSWADVSIVLQNLADAQTLCGALREAIASASEALFYAGVAEAEPIWIVALWRRLVEGAPRHALASSQTDAASLRQAMGPKAKASSRTPKRPSSLPARVVKMECESRVFRAHALSLAGELTASSRDFGAADTIERAEDSDNDALYSGRGIEWCRHRMQLGELAVARRLTEANRVICESQGANADLARCDLLLGEFDLEVGDRASAGRRIGEAVRVFREARQGQDLPEALLAQARLGRSMEDCEEALRMARKSTFALMECDALNLRAVLRRELAKPADLSVAAQKAYDDAHAALVIAERCEYYWGRHEALRQLCDAAKALRDRPMEKHWDEAEKEVAARMKPEIEEALRINREHDAEMEKLYGKK